MADDRDAGKFSRKSAERIASCVRWSEGQPRGTGRGEGRIRRYHPAEIRRFVLKTALAPTTTPPGSASAYIVLWDTTNEDYTVDTDDENLEFTVYDVTGNLRGEAYDSTYWKRHLGRAIQAPDSGHFEIIALAHKARFIEFSATEAVDTTDASFSADVEDYWDGYDPDPTDAGITVYNQAASSDYIFECDNGDMGIARYDEWDGKYRWVQGECP